MSITVILILSLLAYNGQAILAGIIARKRRHTFWFWFLVALILIFPMGFIATLIYTKDPNVLI